MAMQDEKGKPRVEVAVHPDGAAGVCVFDGKAKTRAELIVHKNGSPGMELSDSKGSVPMAVNF